MSRTLMGAIIGSNASDSANRGPDAALMRAYRLKPNWSQSFKLNYCPARSTLRTTAVIRYPLAWAPPLRSKCCYLSKVTTLLEQVKVACSLASFSTTYKHILILLVYIIMLLDTSTIRGGETVIKTSNSLIIKISGA